MKSLIGYDGEELMDQSLYSYHHALDNDTLDKAYKDCEYPLVYMFS